MEIDLDFHKKDSFINKNIMYLFNTDIYEYDMKSAGTSIMEEFQIVSGDIISHLKELPKKQRVVYEGNLQKNKEIASKLRDGFAEIRKRFYIENSIELDDIVSVNKDAIFVTKRCNELKFGCVRFAEKNHYSSYVRLSRYQFYYNGEVDVKGISDKIVGLHDDGMLRIVRTFFRNMETSDKKTVLIYLRRVITDYKTRKLPIEYYREFTPSSKYTVIDGDWEYDSFWEDRVYELDISYNLENVLLPLTIIAV